MGLHLAQEDNNLKRLSMLCVLGEDPERGVPGYVLWKVSTALADLSLPFSLPCSPPAPLTQWVAAS